MFRLFLAAAPPAVWNLSAWLAQQQTGTSDSGGLDYLDLLNRFGPWALFVLLVMVGKFVPGFLHERVWEDNQKKDAEIRRLSDAAMEKVLPAVTESNRVVREALDVIARATEVIKDAERANRRAP